MMIITGFKFFDTFFFIFSVCPMSKTFPCPLFQHAVLIKLLSPCDLYFDEKLVFLHYIDHWLLHTVVRKIIIEIIITICCIEVDGSFCTLSSF